MPKELSQMNHRQSRNIVKYPIDNSNGQFDLNIFDEISSWQDDTSTDILGEIVERYLATASPQVAAMLQHAQSRNAIGVRNAAHLLRASSGAMGIVRFAELCRTLETMASENSLDGLAQVAQSAANEFKQTSLMLAEMLQRKSA